MLKVDLFPDTGHHYIFLAKLPDADLPDDFKDACSGVNPSPWQEWVTEKGGRPFVRWRLGKRSSLTKVGLDEYGVWCAIETNTGDFARGTVYVPPRPLTPEPVGDNTPKPPYHSRDGASGERMLIEIRGMNGKKYFEDLSIRWARAEGDALWVDLVIDFGNSRTSAVFVESPENPKVGQQLALSDLLRPVVLIPRGCEHQALGIDFAHHADQMVVDSWFILHEPMFSLFEPPHLLPKDAMRHVTIESRKLGMFGLLGSAQQCVVGETRRIPQMFVEMAPVVLGAEAAVNLVSYDFNQGGNVFLSSPKRYAWDNDPVTNPYWHMVANHWSPPNADEGQNPLLAATILRFMPERGFVDYGAIEEWPIDAPPNQYDDKARRPHANPAEPTFPRSDTIVWVALALIENAHRQFCSAGHRDMNSPFTDRKLRSITITFPPGWTELERRAYRRKWQTAVNIYSLSHLAASSPRPYLHMDVDEAFASQFPIIYGEITKMGSVGENWIELVGRDQGKNARVRVLSIDVGGGTTDFSVVEYRDNLPGEGVDLRTSLLFKDSSSMAGDVLVKNLIESVIIPGLGSGWSPEQRRAFESNFNGTKPQQGHKEEWKRITRLMLIPKAVQILSALAAGSTEPVKDNFDRFGRPLWDEGTLGYINKLGGGSRFPALQPQSAVNYRIEDVNACIQRTFAHLFDSLAKFVTVFEVDLVVASGKPTELPEVKRLLEKALPLLQSRIIHTKGYEIGSWYPFRTVDGRIADAKTVTSVGAALYRAIRNRSIVGWNIRPDPESGRGRFKKNIWVALSQIQAGQVIYLSRGQDESTTSIDIGKRIGRKLLADQQPEPVYIVAWANPDNHWTNGPVDITLRRRSFKNGASSEAGKGAAGLGGDSVQEEEDSLNEYLEIVKVEGTVEDPEGNEIKVSADDVILKPCTLENANFWMDDPDYQVDWRFWEAQFAAGIHGL